MPHMILLEFIMSHFKDTKAHVSFFLRLVGDVLLCTGFLSYSGPFNQEFRNKLQGDWQAELTRRKIPFTENLNLTAMLVDNATVCYYMIKLLVCTAKGDCKHT